MGINDIAAGYQRCTNIHIAIVCGRGSLIIVIVFIIQINRRITKERDNRQGRVLNRYCAGYTQRSSFLGCGGISEYIFAGNCIEYLAIHSNSQGGHVVILCFCTWIGKSIRTFQEHGVITK